MKLSDLLASRKTIVRQATLANLAYAFQNLQTFATRIANARLHGFVRLHHPDGTGESLWPSLTALAGNQSVIEEHFTDGDILEMAEAVFFVADNTDRDVTFPIEDLATMFLTPLREIFEKSGVTIDLATPAEDLSNL